MDARTKQTENHAHNLISSPVEKTLEFGSHKNLNLASVISKAGFHFKSNAILKINLDLYVTQNSYESTNPEPAFIIQFYGKNTKRASLIQNVCLLFTSTRGVWLVVKVAQMRLDEWEWYDTFESPWVKTIRVQDLCPTALTPDSYYSHFITSNANRDQNFLMKEKMQFKKLDQSTHQTNSIPW